MRRELALTAVDLYDRYFVAMRSLEINAEHVELMRVMRGGATAQFESGRGSAQDPLQAESELAHLEHDTAVLTSQREILVAQMNELLHRDPERSASAASEGASRLPPLPDVRDPKRLETEAASERPDIVALRLRARAEQSRAERAGREYYPDFTVSTSYNSMWDTPEHRRWMVGVGFNLPIQTGARAGAADEATAMRAQFESDASRLGGVGADPGLRLCLKQLEESHHVLRLFEERLLPGAREQIDAARAGYTASRNPFMAVIEAERNLRGVELDYQMARADCDRHRAELERALGRIPGLDGKGRISDDRWCSRSPRLRRAISSAAVRGAPCSPLAVLFRKPLASLVLRMALELVSVRGERRSSVGVTAAPGEIDHYTCSMHPSVKQKGPGTCPICGMTLVPVTREQQEQGVVMIDEARRQLIGVRTGPVTVGPMRQSFRAVGQITYDESKLADVTLKVQGFITKLFVSQTGQRVAMGQPLLSLYSPELYNAQQDFLLANKGDSGSVAGAAATMGSVSGAPGFDLGRAARQRLHLLGLSDAQISNIEKTGAPTESVTISSPASGFVIEKNVVDGASVDPGMRLFRIAALNKVWVEADVYEGGS